MLEKIRGKEILVIGLARSGMAAINLLLEKGAASVVAVDRKQFDDLRDEIAVLKRSSRVKIVTGHHSPELATTSLAMIVKSPGVPPTLEIFSKALELKIPIISEIELAYAFIRAPIIGVTGTNGKTTTTALITAMLKQAKINPVVSAGNIGNPLCEVVGKVDAQGMIVAELSSFQLLDIDSFRPAVAVFLNFAEDHIDYHGSVEDYFQAKVRIFKNQRKGDFVVLNAGDDQVAALEQKVAGHVVWFNRSPVKSGFGLENEQVMFYRSNSEPVPVCPQSEIALPGEHNLENALAASAAAWAAGADLQSIRIVLQSFQALEHRLEKVATIDGVEYINDSKGTNPGATIKALQSFPGRQKILIAGGKYKGGDFSELAASIDREISFLILLGESSVEIARAVESKGFKYYIQVESLEEAVLLAAKKAHRGEIVILSPACASWDMFKDYEERGNLFKTLVANLQDRKTGREDNHA